MKLLKKNVDALKLPEGINEKIFFDDDIGGFGVRLRRGGSRGWIFQYKIGNKNRRLSLGAVAAIGVDQARKTAADLHAKVRLGQDPAADKSEARSAETVESAIKQYLRRQEGHLRPRSFEEVERHLLVQAEPLHKEPLGGVDRRIVATFLTALPSNATHVRASLSAFWSWAIREGLVDANPVALTNRPTKILSRERTLATNELRDIWRALDKEDDYGAVVRLLALTGARRDEIGSLAWSEVDLDAAVVRLPSERVKNHRPFDLPLNRPALEILRGRACRKDRDFIFGRGEGGFSGWSACKRRLDERIDALRKKEGRVPMPPWVLHDLRRTLSTRMHEELGISPHVVEACLNHISGHQAGVAGVYNRAAYSAEKRHALDRWAEHVLAVVEGRED